MRRILMLAILAAAFIFPQTALANSFSFGPNINGKKPFNDEVNAFTNITALNNALGNSATLVDLGTPASLNPSIKYSIAGIGYSGYAANNEIALYNGSQRVGDTTMKFHVSGEYNEAELGDFYVEYFNEFDFTVETVMLETLLTGVYISNGEMNFSIDGDPVGYSLPAGTLFYSFALPDNDNTTDFILAVSPTSAVPVPAALWLLGTGVGGLAVIRRRMR